MRKITRFVLFSFFILMICNCGGGTNSDEPENSNPGRVATPVLSPSPGVISNPVEVTITCSTPDAVLYYTIDGSIPEAGNAATQVYSSPIAVDPGTVVWAYAAAPEMTDSDYASGYYSAAESAIPVGVNVSWFNTWNESQPLANVAVQGRTGDYSVLPVDSNGDPIHDFKIGLYEGPYAGVQSGAHLCRFNGLAGSITISESAVSNIAYDPATNTTTFTYTTDGPANSSVTFTNTQRDAGSAVNTGITNLMMMRPGHDFDDFVNGLFVSAIEPFKCFRVGPNWDFMYVTDAPVWSERVKPDKIQYGAPDASGSAAWETLIKMANEMNIDLWICLPPNADNDYLTKIFQIFMYGSDGVNPYTSTQTDPVWAPLNPDRKLYFEVGNEIWNWGNPFGIITNQMDELAETEYNAGDPHHYMYAEDAYGVLEGIRRRLAYLTVNASLLCRSVVGDSRMMTQFRPVLSGQSAYEYQGELSLSYLRCVYGGYDWHTAWAGGGWPGKYNSLVYAEDGTTENSFGIIARPITYYIYGYATAPYVNGDTISELHDYFIDNVQGWMLSNIATANDYGVVPLAYEGGIEVYSSYTDEGIDTVIEDMLNFWFSNGGDLFCYYSFAGNSGSGLIPDLTRQDPDDWPKLRAVRNVMGLH